MLTREEERRNRQEEIDKSALQILQRMIKDPSVKRYDGQVSFTQFCDRLRMMHTGLSLTACQFFYQKYMGWSKEVRPTHDVNTGRPFAQVVQR